MIRIIILVVVYNREICRSYQRLHSQQKIADASEIAIVSEIGIVMVVLLYTI